LAKQIDQELDEQQYASHFSGFYLMDAETGEDIVTYHADKAFTPASITKVFTLYASLTKLPEFVPALRMGYAGDTLFISGTGDPSAMHPDLQDSTAVNFLRKETAIIALPAPFSESPWGPGWSWEDFDQYYSPERSTMPIYGNILRLWNVEENLVANPMFFIDSITDKQGYFGREWKQNHFTRIPESGDTIDIPFITNTDLELKLWSEATGKTISKGSWPAPIPLKSLPGISRDSICKRMMEVSDNFLAEQLMIMVSAELGDTLGFEIARNHLLENSLKDLPQTPRWVDGSGLSRYNLFTPRTVVYLLKKMHSEVPEAQLFNLMAKGGGNGTLKQWQNDNNTPYLFGKSGSMGGVQNLCGYLKTRSGKTLIFSFMNNHITGPGLPVKQRMHEIIHRIYETY
jgi:D-alanyl-D-alanine carboxypeptidase/D-alanyl-D-alanine-endopeptidase (penicillin-binding protein 4)